MTSALSALACRFNIVKLHVTVQLQQDTTLPDFKGSMLHGWFGHALKAVDEHSFYVCYGIHAEQQPKPYMICPSLDHKTDWKKGELLDFDITLFGDVTKLAPQVVDAIKHASENKRLGFGVKRTPFKVLSIASHTPSGLKPGVYVCSLADWFNNEHDYIVGNAEIALNFVTPVRIKHHGQVIKSPVLNHAFWANQILRRLMSLSRFWAVDDRELFDLLYRQVEQQLAVNCDMDGACYFEDWQRYSLKQKEQLPFGGLKGQLSFYGELKPLISLFKIGELLHIGGKTTFGLGKYQLIAG
ncbi:CRISPR system precrRNA processing endoribonuclease RAMP protein Cas6 [Photobacterium kishitanii]|uniref:CRISPR system precrRNA processing endoribonuclease RAMP protein Cas6 n=1 Tax=Photobacterium kishitanii TaxID=318456 RepID=UPI0007F8DD4E|nr:CRISPR system precrRNA processing endoribonuclease RAMP protein Cas6 [Photobacterium kishitanii]OBU30191.1 hypothetical protein AYY23_21690 [Photobacterium kishitanii]PSW46827.1 CRISPR system precrRNA processing endoribonuclease RAMP protein Cas6 [Photobacterium kishitanii]